jgi:hypothetical protein
MTLWHKEATKKVPISESDFDWRLVLLLVEASVDFEAATGGRSYLPCNGIRRKRQWPIAAMASGLLLMG